MQGPHRPSRNPTLQRFLNPPKRVFNPGCADPCSDKCPLMVGGRERFRSGPECLLSGILPWIQSPLVPYFALFVPTSLMLGRASRRKVTAADQTSPTRGFHVAPRNRCRVLRETQYTPRAVSAHEHGGGKDSGSSRRQGIGSRRPPAVDQPLRSPFVDIARVNCIGVGRFTDMG